MLPLRFVVAIILFKNVITDLRVDPLVDTNVGLIRGLEASDGDYSMFLGIPYAMLDKENPFGVSFLPHPKFTEVFEAYDDSAVCPQRNSNSTITGTLDCLHLNVFTPNSATSLNLRPVLVFVHGGFLQRGGFNKEMYGPKFLMQHDIVLITINYRLGPYGFMCLNTPEIPGNQGLKDQLKALRWIQDNIAAFGGDPDQVTLAGQSAGGASVDFHLMYPGERLFNKVILQSGVANPERMIEADIEKPIKLAEYFEFKNNDVNDALTFLATKDTDSIIEATLELGIGFRACVEKEFEGVEIFVPQHPATADRPHVKNIPVLIGSVDKEFLSTYADKESDFFQNLTIFRDSLQNVFDFGDDLDVIHRNLRNFYVGDHLMTDEDKWQVVDFESDFTYVHPIQRAMRKYRQSEAGNIYFYVFDYDGGRNFVKYRDNVNAPGATHADELGYLFDPSLITEEPSSEDQAVIDRMTTMWANFVKTGNPTPSPSDVVPISWTPITADRWHCLWIGADLRLKGRPFHHRMAFWDLFLKTYGHLEKGVELL
ncbi:LOW QUALITY PROTEIN: esterase FE4-like [Leguminivora glycinivorella]|uniref:LOW QUALITY PROTEIN: esterase FE4-like n=1 Tax=Leguminivora glycinivorella TaxID=1035111 RepID=UPI00200C445E|nr:LOW QUALITY PROTEIN: esterase FE4-like [Leguminivora glycinivorella]